MKQKLFLVAAILWTLGIFIGCSLPGKDLPPVDLFDHFDKVVHFTFFFVFAILWLGIRFPSLEGTKGWVLVVILSFSYGFFLEWYQINFVPGRSWDVWDGIADGVGGSFGCLFASKLYLWTNKLQ